MAVPHIDLTASKLAKLSSVYGHAITNVEAGRTEIINNYTRWVQNYEGDVAPSEDEKPWQGASEAHIPKTATDVDVTYARLMNAVFGQFPKFMIRPLSGAHVEFAREVQGFSEYLEEIEIPLYRLLQKTFLVTIKFGSAVIYAPWGNRLIKNMVLTPEGEFVKEEGFDELNKPDLKLIHPQDWLLPIHAQDIQSAPWCGYKYKVGSLELQNWIDTKFVLKTPAKELIEGVVGNSDKDAHLEIPVGEQTQDRLQETREQIAGLARVEAPDQFEMVHIWARMDIDGDGQIEDVNFHMHLASGKILRVAFNHYRHNKRPFVDFHFFPRDGIWYSIGIPEMLANTQSNMDVTMRQIQDNNTVKNTQSFKSLENNGLSQNESFHPAKIYFVRDMTGFEPLRMGDSSLNTSVNDLDIMQLWGDRRTGISDPASGIGGNDRTPATTTLALLQEASRRVDLIIGGLRDSLAELWMQVLELYAQFKPVVEFERQVKGQISKFEMLRWNAKNINDFRKRILIKPTASTSALNKAVARQEMTGLLEQIRASNQSTVQLLDVYLQAQDPSLKIFLEKTMRGEHLVLERILDTYEFAKDSDNVLPDPEEFLPDVNPAQPPVSLGGPGQQPNPALGSTQGLLPGPGAGSAPQTAPNKPAQDGGVPRLQGLPSGAPGTS